jgi:Rrf2 family protein
VSRAGHNVVMRISAKVDYAMRALVELAADGSGGPVTSERLAEAQGIPQKFLQNILLELRRAGIVASHRGPDGGHALARPADAITVADVIRAVDGPLGAVAGHAPEDMEYHGATMRLRDTWVAVRASVRSVLEGITLADIASDHLPESIGRLLVEHDAWVRR